MNAALTDGGQPPDRALRAIVASNALALVLAVALDWSLGDLLWPFWVQSVVIGWYARQRILALRRFTTDDLRINGRPVPPTPDTQQQVANFFALHYGAFHLAYFVFLLRGLPDGAARAADASFATDLLGWVGIAAASVAFWHTHRGSFREHVAADLAGAPNIGKLMFLPYARILPMHLTIIFGATLGGGGALWLFILLKTGADVVMHKAEHRLLQKSSAPARAE